MKLITWNCNGGFEKKAEQFFECRPDVAVVQECSEASACAEYRGGYTGLWFGSNRNKGLAVFCKEGWVARVRADPAQQWIVPVGISGNVNFTLVAVWACAVRGSRRESYVGQIHRSLSSGAEWLSDRRTVFAGDFNSNAVWDRNRNPDNHSSMVKKLARLGLVSAYHSATGETHGQESQPTFHLYRHADKPYHLDYVFIPKRWRPRSRVRVGGFDDWSKLSDHYPVVVELD